MEMWPRTSLSLGAAAAGDPSARHAARIPARHAIARGLSAIEADGEAVAVLNHIVPSLQSLPAPLPRTLLASRLEQLVPWHDLGANESLGEVAVDLSGRVDRALSFRQRPGAHFVLAHGEERDQAEQPIAGADHRGETVLDEAQFGPESRATRFREAQH